MAEYKPVTGHHEIPGFFESLMQYLGAGADYFGARLSLLGLEARDAAVKYLMVLVLVVTAIIALLFGYIFLWIALVFILQRLLHWDWVYITLGVCLVHFAVTAGCLMLAWSRLKSSSFSTTVAEFKKDKQWLTSKKVPTASAS